MFLPSSIRMGGRFISLERIVEETKEGYYDTLYQCSQGWLEGKHPIVPWWEYFLAVVMKAYQEFEKRVGAVTTARGAKRQMVLDSVERLPKQLRYSDVAKLCPWVSRPTINRTLAELRKSRKIRVAKPGKDAIWEKT